MKIIPEKVVYEQELILSIKSFAKRFSVATALSKANACKRSGFSPISIVQCLVQLVFTQMSVYRDSLNGEKSTINNSRDIGYHSVGRLKNGRTRYLLDGKPCTLHAQRNLQVIQGKSRQGEEKELDCFSLQREQEHKELKGKKVCCGGRLMIF